MLARVVHPRFLTALLAVAVTAMACSTDTPTDPTGSSTATGGGGSGSGGGVGGSGGSGGVGRLAINITDSPFSDAMAVLVRFSEVSVHRSGAGWETLDFSGGSDERTCDLKKLVGAVDVLGVGALPEGHYTQIRLTVDSADIYFDSPSIGAACQPFIAPPGGKSAPVEIPSGTLKLNREFTLEPGVGTTTTILLDFDGDKSIRLTGSGNDNGNGNGRGRGQGNAGRYMMNPVIGIASVTVQ
jgi:hypothetical protein